LAPSAAKSSAQRPGVGFRTSAQAAFIDALIGELRNLHRGGFTNDRLAAHRQASGS
jgi:hypothetical protein